MHLTLVTCETPQPVGFSRRLGYHPLRHKREVHRPILFSLKNPDGEPTMRPTPVRPQLNGVGADGPAGVGILGDYTCCSGWVFESHKFR